MSEPGKGSISGMTGEKRPTPGSTAPFLCAVSSFGYKYGIASDADWVIDARTLPNPFWVPELRPHTGLDDDVREYVLATPEAREFIVRVGEMVEWAVAKCIERERTALHVAIGCTGGRHRSVVVSAALAQRLEGRGVAVTLHHRDVERPDPR